MHDNIKILDIEEKQNSFSVVFEVPGRHYNQNYPKRLTHSFPLEPHLLEKKDNDDYKFEKTLRKNYLKTGNDKQKKEECCNKLEKCRKDVRGKSLDNSNQ